MLRNIDVLAAIEKESELFLVSADEVDAMLDVEDTNLTELISDEDEEVLFMLEKAENIEKLLKQLTEDLRTTIDYEDFDCESYSWCLAKVRHNTIEIENYFEPIWAAIQALNAVAKMILSGNKILMQYACTKENTQKSVS